MHSPWKKLVAVVFVLALVGAACGDDDDGDDAATDDTTAGDDTAAGATVEVTGVNFEFEGLPDTIEAGSEISFTNEAEDELHEFVAVRIPDDEERSVEELLQLPQEELIPLLGQQVTDVVISTPGQTNTPGAVEGDGVLDEPGRYAVICAIPTGVDPQEYLDAAAETEEGPPQIEDAGPPHFTQGMFAEVTVE